MNTAKRRKKSAGPLSFGQILAEICERAGAVTWMDKMRLFHVSYNYIPEIISGRRRATLRQAIEWGRRFGYSDQVIAQAVLQGELAAVGLPFRIRLTNPEGVGA
jgi:plasmid maintenance system antidote protein VapI